MPRNIALLFSPPVPAQEGFFLKFFRFFCKKLLTLRL
nr:MAG TPA: hypothetical protein [Caudoviricetes sp.]